MRGAEHTWGLFLIWLAVGQSSYAQEVIFGSAHEASSECTTRDGNKGRCLDIRKCPKVQENFRTNPPTHCGFSGFSPVVCCPLSAEPVNEGPKDGDTVQLVDISPPDFAPGFECGVNSARRVSTLFQKRSVPTPDNFPHVRPTGLPDLSLLPVDGILAVLNQPKVPKFEGGLLKPSVVGGIDAKANAWPWMALLGNKENDGKYNWFCAGALINDQWVLTAAHCVDGTTLEVVRLGEHNYNSDQDGAKHVDFSIQQIIPHPNYTQPTAYHDLALLQLSRKVVFETFIHPVCLPWGEESERDLIGTQVKLTGWGDTQFLGSPSSILQEVDLTIFPNSKCEANYSRLRHYSISWPNGIGNETTCAGDEAGGRDACQGDSGGPIVYRSNGKYTINGVVSRGYGCGLKDYPGIYANIQYPDYLAWIKKTAF
ncbi:CLIP domain-containing serine protease [Halocaridina rubra]|uniref:CLIP domain-containing serine protease n=1 Tax=Halocaridina rubra TaxID=373956 RepID=A0AAN8X2C3_HALRR